MNIEKTEAFKKELKELLEKYNVTIEKEYDYYDACDIVATGPGINVNLDYL